MYKLLLTIFVLFGLLVPFAYADNWVPNTTIVNGISTLFGAGTNSWGNSINNTIPWLVVGISDGSIPSFSWNTTQWIRNTTVNQSLVDVGTYSMPHMFYMSGNLNALVGRHGSAPLAYTHNGTHWLANTTLDDGLTATSPVISVINSSLTGNVPWLLQGSYDPGSNIVTGYSWNGSRWINNATVNLSISDVTTGRDESYPSMFELDNKLYCIVGEYEDDNNITLITWGYVHNGTHWVTNSSIISGFSNVISNTTTYPANAVSVLKLNTEYYAIQWVGNGTIYGYWYNTTHPAGGGDTVAPIITLNAPTNGTTIATETWALLNATSYDETAGTQNILFKKSDGTTLCTNNSVTNNTFVVCNYTSLTKLTNYKWYITSSDGTNTATSSTNNFTTNDTTVPVITIVSPANSTLTSTSVWYNITVDETASLCRYNLDLAGYVDMSGSGTAWNKLVTTANGVHNVTYQCNDTTNNLGTSANRVFTVNNNVYISTTITSPTNTNYTTDNIWFNSTTNVSASICQYQLDSSSNVTMDGATTSWYKLATSVLEGSHTGKIYCNSSTNIWAVSSTISFEVDKTIPTIILNAPSNGSTLAVQNWALLNLTSYDLLHTPLNITFYNETGSALCTNNTIANNTPVVCNFTGLTVDTNYKWYANSTDAVGNIAKSSVNNFTTHNNNLPVITLYAPTNGTTVSAETWALLNASSYDDFDATQNITFYNETGSALCTNNTITNNTPVVCNFTGLTANTNYKWYVNSTDVVGISQSSVNNFTTNLTSSTGGIKFNMFQPSNNTVVTTTGLTINLTTNVTASTCILSSYANYSSPTSMTYSAILMKWYVNIIYVDGTNSAITKYIKCNTSAGQNATTMVNYVVDNDDIINPMDITLCAGSVTSINYYDTLHHLSITPSQTVKTCYYSTDNTVWLSLDLNSSCWQTNSTTYLSGNHYLYFECDDYGHNHTSMGFPYVAFSQLASGSPSNPRTPETDNTIGVGDTPSSNNNQAGTINLIPMLISNLFGRPDTCGDAICQDNENYLNCPDDCKFSYKTLTDEKAWVFRIILVTLIISTLYFTVSSREHKKLKKQY
jgi:hypothetical protein